MSGDCKVTIVLMARNGAGTHGILTANYSVDYATDELIGKTIRQ